MLDDEIPELDELQQCDEDAAEEAVEKNVFLHGPKLSAPQKAGNGRVLLYDWSGGYRPGVDQLAGDGSTLRFSPSSDRAPSSTRS